MLQSNALSGQNRKRESVVDKCNSLQQCILASKQQTQQNPHENSAENMSKDAGICRRIGCLQAFADDRRGVWQLIFIPKFLFSPKELRCANQIQHQSAQDFLTRSKLCTLKLRICARIRKFILIQRLFFGRPSAFLTNESSRLHNQTLAVATSSRSHMLHKIGIFKCTRPE